MDPAALVPQYRSLPKVQQVIDEIDDGVDQLKALNMDLGGS